MGVPYLWVVVVRAGAAGTLSEDSMKRTLMLALEL